MKNTVLFFGIGLLFTMHAKADQKCFLVKENDKVIIKEGNCDSRHAPCSTFKIVISLMGYDSGILKDETHPELPFMDGYADYMDNWKQPHNPRLWIKNSNVWYSQVLTQKLGMDKFKEYVIKLNYGNKDVSGDKGADNGLIRSWLSSSLEISPGEQTAFLQKLIDNKLPVSIKAQKMTKNILFVEDLPNGWKLYGKTGSGSLLNADKTQKLDNQIGWFVGWVQKDSRNIVFAYYIEDKQTTYAGPRAKAAARKKLIQMINDIK